MAVFIEVADTIDSCRKKIFDNYGQNVTIISTRPIKKAKLFGLIQKDAVEITFTVRENSVEMPNTKLKETLSKIDKLHEKEILDTQKSPSTINHHAKGTIAASKNISPYITEPVYVDPKTEQENKNLYEVLDFMQTSIHTLADRISLVSSEVSEKQGIQKLTQILERNGFSHGFIQDTIRYVKKHISLDQEEDFTTIQRCALNRIAASIKTANFDLPEASDLPFGLVFCLVGPTGVGKTTTVAKLSAYYYLSLARHYAKKLSVSIITIDSYRIGAWEQINKYCQHMGIPLTVATTDEELQTAINEGKSKYDVVFIDTTGRSPNDTSKISEMSKYFRGVEDQVVFFLTINASTQYVDIENTLKAYSSFPYTSIVVTKTDEVSSFGSLITALDKTQIPISYITIGQNVPSDIKCATKSFFLKALKGFEEQADFIDETFKEESSGEILWR